jgi:acyl carrier protein
MNKEQLADLVKRTLYEVAPDLESEPLDPNARFNEQFEFDSMDFLNFITGLHRATGLELPEKDYPRLSSQESAVAYLAEKLSQ